MSMPADQEIDSHERMAQMRLFGILNELGQEETAQREASMPPTRFWPDDRMSWTILAVLVLLLIGCAYWRTLEDALWLSVANQFILVVLYVTWVATGIAGGQEGWKRARLFWKYPFMQFLNRAEDAARADLRHLAAIAAMPAKVVKLTMLELVYEREHLAERVKLLVGTADKVGLLPGLLAASYSIEKLKDAPMWSVTLAIALGITSALANLALLSAKRLDRMVKLLEMDIARREAESGDPR